MNADLQFCADEVNRYRAMLGKPAYARSTMLESYAADGARIDGTAHSAHKHFLMGGGVAKGENEIPWASLRQEGSIRQILKDYLAGMWSEGPGSGAAHIHYTNMAGSFREIGCGIFVNGDEVTIPIDFR